MIQFEFKSRTGLVYDVTLTGRRGLSAFDVTAVCRTLKGGRPNTEKRGAVRLAVPDLAAEEVARLMEQEERGRLASRALYQHVDGRSAAPLLLANLLK